jgi:ketosteroid isomerase-like protein
MVKPVDGELKTVIERLAAEGAIRTLIYTHCRALDRCDQDLLASLYHPDAVQVQGPFNGPASQFIAGALAKFRSIEFGSHHITNMVIDVDGDFAKVESWYLGFARVSRDAQGLPWDRVVTGRNLDALARRDGAWKISSRFVVYDSNQLVRGSADSDDANLAHYAPWGRRDDSDISCRFHAAARDTGPWWEA